MKHNLIFLFLLLAVLCGCSDRVKVKGTVTYDTGEPVTMGMVKFVGEKTQATGSIQKNGTYVLGEIKPRDGVKPGTYGVTVYSKEGGGSDRSPIKYFVDAKFENPATSGLTCEVKKKTTYDIVVTKPAPGTEIQYPGSGSAEPLGPSGLPISVEQGLRRAGQLDQYLQNRQQQQ